jgi:outer membrane protein
MTRKRLSRMVAVVAAAGAWTAGTAIVSAQSDAASAAHIQELIKQAAERLGADPQGTGTQPAGQAGAPAAAGPTVRLTLDEAVKLALDRNLDIAVQRLNPEISDVAIASVISFYHPALTSTVGWNSVQTPANSTIGGSSTAGTPIVRQTGTYNAGITENMPWGGGAFNLSLNNFRQFTTSQNSLFNPQYQATWTGSYTQPLLRNFTIDATRQQLAVTKLNRDISDVQLRSTITNTLSNVRNAYWDYVFAVESVQVAQQSLDLANKLVQDNQTRVDVGTMAPIDVVSAQSQAATAKQALVAAQATQRTAELAVKRLIVAGTNDPNWSATIDPVDRPEFRPEPVDLQAAVGRALSERTDIEIAKKTVQENDVTLKYLGDQVKPQVDFVATYGFIGLGGTVLERQPGGGVNAPIIGTTPGTYFDALSTLTRNPQWTAQLNISYPLFQSTQDANIARARVQLGQVQAQLKQVELQVATDVTNAVLTVQSDAERVQAAQAASELAQKTLEAEQSKFEVGMSTNFNVIQFQRDLATARNNELQAVLNYRKALVELARLQQTTLSSLNVTLLSTGGGGGTTTRVGQ